MRRLRDPQGLLQASDPGQVVFLSVARSLFFRIGFILEIVLALFRIFLRHTFASSTAGLVRQAECEYTEFHRCCQLPPILFKVGEVLHSHDPAQTMPHTPDRMPAAQAYAHAIDTATAR